MNITLTYSSIDGVRKTRKFKTLAGARAFAQHWVGEHPDISGFGNYAVSFDGVGKLTCHGDVKLAQLFPADELQDAADEENDDMPPKRWDDLTIPHGYFHDEPTDDDCPF